ncbi:FKBP-type peptidyl-prolyl cis-trans isomerase FkpA [Mucilaginibacter gracilis]|uniref:Peptidyl-prolyl cis-trans isomerase n=1 Tax=Mucilaginibacter gracilis TaxID=423350 RepID=A0A495IVQ1_9SPHI|nr:FKBP-type peptidyl-prolyl cis-trans isomerase [Mucilaginibacter gracilis]RKR80825.1 FKBP-type peptidyl-prolyl cis-trans isomerase FkpA [Mucilaginibacter gracilis]
MKKLGYLLSVICTLFVSCGKKEDTFDPVKQAAADDAAIQAYIKANNITATKDASGLYYQIVTQGTGVNASASSTVTVNYTGKFLDGTQFDSTSSPGRTSFSTQLVTNGVAQVIQGWVIGIPLVKAGGRILLLIPSALAYGPSGYGSIPGNSVLAFSVDVLNVR